MNEGLHLVGVEEVKRNWAWFLVLGILLVILGTVSLGYAVAVTLLSIIFFGCLMIVGGVLTAGHAFLRKQWSGFFVDLFLGMLYTIVGVLLVSNPVGGATTATLLIALFLMVGGLSRIFVAITVRLHHRIWILLNGVITLLLGVLIWARWPLSGLLAIGIFIGIEMILYGWSLVMLALTAKALPEPPAPPAAQ